MRTLLQTALASALLIPASVIAASDPPTIRASRPEAGEGVLCLWALTSTAAEVGRRCPGGDPGLQAALDDGVARLDRYVAVNGKVSNAFITAFKRRHGGVGQGTDSLCSTDALRLYREMRAQGGAALSKAIEQAVSRPGMPAWGDCL